MSNWKYADASNKVVARTNADGSSESCFVSVIADWLAAGNTPTPADVPNPNGALLSQIDAIERASLCNRGAREGWIALLLQQGAAAGMTKAALLDPVTGNSYFRKLIEIDLQVRALRDRIV